VNFLSEQDRTSVIALHRWSLSSELAGKDNVVFLQTETLSEIHPKIVGNPRVTTVEVPLPVLDDRKEVLHYCDPSLDEAQLARLSAHTGGLKTVQIVSLLSPKMPSDLEEHERKSFIEGLLSREANAKERADKLSALTRGMSRDEIRKLLKPETGVAEALPVDPQESVLKALSQRKREIIERECSGLIEFIEPKHDLSAVGGLDEIKEELRQIAEAVRKGDQKRSPMGLLMVGPMGCGKTFVANAFIKESGLSAVRLKNFRSKWVGSTEANLEKVLNMVRALGPIALVVDEGDRALGDEGDSDGGTGSRVIARLKEFMSDPQNRGVVLVILMTNRPDKLDVDMKRAGRLDKKIPFFYADQAKDVEAVLDAQFRRHGIAVQLNYEEDRSRTSERLVGYSNADIEAVVLLAHELSARGSSTVTAELLATAIEDYVPSRDADMLEYMELLAAFEASRRSLLPARLRDLTSQELNQRLKDKRASIRA
jgi:SpoVK/Ycf46/Vps4 family AAA+-type ATPase